MLTTGIIIVPVFPPPLHLSDSSILMELDIVSIRFSFGISISASFNRLILFWFWNNLNSCNPLVVWLTIQSLWERGTKISGVLRWTHHNEIQDWYLSIFGIMVCPHTLYVILGKLYGYSSLLGYSFFWLLYCFTAKQIKHSFSLIYKCCLSFWIYICIYNNSN